ncbi:hypothetical protein DFJ73DRAFT_464725 [Zopfochytrium polystomum]|nr:hypothetical protein DFJ73DRAFT_464725 [Zopfochytrium polystomum]
MHCVAGLITNPEVPSKVLSKLKYVGTDLAERMVQTLMSKRLLDSYSLGRMHSCPLSVLNMDAYPLMTDSLLEKIITLHWTTLSKLSLRSCTYLTDVGFSGIQHCRTLTHLDVSSCKVTDAIVPFIAGLQCLEHLNLSRTKISSDGVRAIAKGSSGTISELILSHCVNLTDNTLLVDLQVLSNLAILNISSSHVKAPFIPPPATAFRALEVFEAAHTNITDDDLRCFVSGLSMLRVFDVSSSRSVTSAGLRWVCSSCANLSTLKVAPIEPEADAAVARVLLVVGSKKKLPLEALDLAGFSVTDEALGETLSGFNETLMVLRLSGNKITDEGLSHLKDLKNLTELYLDRTLITDAIFSHIKDLRHLEVLSLAETGVTDAFLRKMGTGDICKSLKRLNLARTVVSDEGIAGLPAMEQLAAITLDQTEVTAAASGPTLWDVRKFPLLKQVRFPVVVATPENPDGDEEDGDGGF